MPTIPALTTFVANTKATAAAFNANFSAIRTYVNTYGAFVDTAATITGTWTFNTAPVFGVTAQFANGANVTGNLAVTGTVTFGTIAIPAASVTAGNFASGAYTFPGTLVAGAFFRGTRTTSNTTTGSVTLDLTAYNHRRVTLTGNSTLTLSNGVAGGIYTVEVLQDATGSRTLAWGADVVWAGGATPTQTSTANRKDVYTFFYDGSKYLGAVFGQNFSSTG